MTMTSYTMNCSTLPGLGKVVEESGELITVLGKFISNHGRPDYWGGRDLDQEVQEEAADVIASTLNFIICNDFDSEFIMNRIADKLDKYAYWRETNQ